MSKSTSAAQALSKTETRFGPPSELIDINGFITSTAAFTETTPHNLFSTNNLSFPGLRELQNAPETERLALIQECSIDDLIESTREISHNMKNWALVHKYHEHVLQNLDPQISGPPKKRKRDNEQTAVFEDLEALHSRMKQEIVLECWEPPQESSIFVRPPKIAELNALSAVKTTAGASSSLSPTTRLAIITISLHQRAWRGRGPVFRTSQHVLLSSQTLGDLFEAMICSTNEQPIETLEDDAIVGYDEPDMSEISGEGVIVVEGVAYGDGLTEQDYAKRLKEHVDGMPENKRPDVKTASTSMHDTPLSSLSVRINEPYWLLHRGNCEHFIVFESIRLQHSTDLSTGYPLTVQLTPVQLDSCRACAKVPSVLSVVGDLRLGESPCQMCGPCWDAMGDPDPDEGVLVIPLPKYQHGY